MTRWSWLCIAAILSGFQAKAIEAVTSYTIFYVQAKDDGYKPYIELYWQINPGSLHMTQQADSLWSATIETQIVLRNDTGIVLTDVFALQTTPTTAANIYNQSIIDLHRYTLPTGNIKLEVQFRDKQKPQNAYVYSDSFTVTAAPAKPFYSDIQLLDTAYASPIKSIFQKNDRLQIPLSMNFIGDERNQLRFYTELYQANTTHHKILVQNTTISKKEFDRAVYKMETTDTVKAAPVIPFTGVFNISTLPSGNYYLNVVLQDEKQEQIAAKSYFFQRSNNAPKAVTADSSASDTDAFAPIYKVNVFDLGNTFVGKFNVAQLRAILRMIQPIGSANERNSISGFLENPDQTYMQYFVYNFFKGRNPENPDKAWQEYTDKVKEVNKLFGGSSTRGYETERGQIYLKYGKPNERVIVLNEPGSLPYEIWQYNAPGKQSSQGIFLFYQPPSIIGDMILLHSTVNGEQRNTQWRSILFNGTSMQSSYSRAEQYLPFR